MTSPVAATVSATGISAPNYAAVYNYLVSQYQYIYGADAWLGNDSQDGQFVGIIAQAITDCNNAAIAVYNSFSPTTAVGNGLSSNVKLNGLTRIVGSFSTKPLTLVGQAQTVITNGQVQDNNGNLWALPATTTIPNSGTINVTATSVAIGAIPDGASWSIATPVLGWQSVSSAGTATVGNAVESDAKLRIRQSVSVSLPSITIFAGILAALEQVSGVTRVTGYENNTNSTNGNGIPANTLCFVVECPSTAQTAVAQAIASKMPPGIATYGNVSTVITDTAGTVRTINQQTPTESTVTAAIQVHPLNGWASSTANLITAAVSAYFSSIAIGGVVNVALATAAATLPGTTYAGTFLVKQLQVNKNGGAYQSTDLTLGFSEAATPGTSSVTTV